jgi:hypothetical protein
MGSGWSRHYVAVTPGPAGIRGVPQLLHNFKTFNVRGPRKTYLTLLMVKRYITVVVEAFAASAY